MTPTSAEQHAALAGDTASSDCEPFMPSKGASSPSCESPLTALRGIGPVRSERMRSAGLNCVGDLLYLLPRCYEDRRRVSRIVEIDTPGSYTVQGHLEALQSLRISSRRLTLVRGRLTSESDSMQVVWFNRPYLISQVDADVEYLLHGAVRMRAGEWELVNPSLERVGGAELGGRVVPVYPAAGVTPSEVRRLAAVALSTIDLEQVEDPLPVTLRDRLSLPGLSESILHLHRPPPDADVEQLNRLSSPYHRRLAYGEILRLQLQLALHRARTTSETKPHRYGVAPGFQRALESQLPFVFTDAQHRVLREILRDLESPHPMMRLLQGDVGCGKTAVAALALAAAAESGLQGALMAPTELLAEQHYREFEGLLGERYPVVLLTSSSAVNGDLRSGLETGETALAIGTHALIQERVRFARLGLVVIDEQHRFGVAQRRQLQEKGDCPDLLVMTATPIPRSLTLTIYGDLSLSVIDELPPGRSPVITKVTPRKRREHVYAWLEEQLEDGASAYVVLPFIEESTAIDGVSIEGLGRDLARRFERFRPAILHGRSSSEQRETVMRDFASDRVRLLLATTLVEVGVDVPRASIMIIESAERFGLAQLHQLRGRVGRGSSQSFCIAIHGDLSREGGRRLEVFAESSDGFRIAEADLEIRGPGDVLGTRQSGVPLFRVADLMRDLGLIEEARRDARAMVERDPSGAEDLARNLGAIVSDNVLAGA